jgi:hypothetical protein
MSSTFNIIAPQIGNPTNANTASYLLGNAQTDTISITPSNPYAGIIQFNNNIRVANVYGTASMASGLVPQTYYITASNAINSLNSINSISASYLKYSAGQNNGTASYAISAAFAGNVINDGFKYPYIKSITFTGSHDDWVNVDLIGSNGIAASNNSSDYTTIGFTNQSKFISSSVVFDMGNFLYKGFIGTNTNVSYRSVSPSQNMILWCDNRGGGPHSLYFTGSINVVFAVSPTTNITHSYVPTSTSTNYLQVMSINALRGANGQNAILDADALENGTITTIFNSFTIS